MIVDVRVHPHCFWKEISVVTQTCESSDPVKTLKIIENSWTSSAFRLSSNVSSSSLDFWYRCEGQLTEHNTKQTADELLVTELSNNIHGTSVTPSGQPTRDPGNLYYDVIFVNLCANYNWSCQK